MLHSAGSVRSDVGEIIKNNFEEIKGKLRELARGQPKQSGDANVGLGTLVKATLSLDYYEKFDKDGIRKEIDYFEALSEELSVSNGLARNGKIVAALVSIFTYSDELFRQRHFHDLMEFYYQQLHDDDDTNRANYNQGIKLALPLVKMQLLADWLKLESSTNKKDIEELLANIGAFFKSLLLNQEDIYEVVRNFVKSDEYTLIHYQLTPMDQASGYLGEYFKLNITVKLDDKLQSIHLFAKFLLPKSKLFREMAQSGMSKKEEFFYTQYLSLLDKYKIKCLENCVPRCYFSRENDVIILDDLVELGFTSLPANSFLEYDALSKGVDKLSRLHASTMLLEEVLSQQKGAKVTMFETYEQYLQEVFFMPGTEHSMKTSFDAALKSIHYMFKVFPEVARGIPSNDLQTFINEVWQLTFEKVKKSGDLRNTICHGDMHVGNVLFRFNPNGKACQDLCLIDFQVLRYCPPTHDLLFFIYENATKEVRSKYLRQLCEEYYASLSRHIVDFGLDANAVYSKEEFEQSLRYMKSQAIAQALFYSGFIKLPTDLRKSTLATEEKTNYYLYRYRWKLMGMAVEDETFKSYVKGLLEDLVEVFLNGRPF